MVDIEVLKGWLASLIRIAGASTIAWLIAKGYLTEETAASLVVIVGGMLAVLISSLIGKVLTQKKVETALKLPAGSSLDQLKATMRGE